MLKISPVNNNLCRNYNSFKPKKPEISFCANEKNIDDPIASYLNYLGRINREIVIPDDEFEERSPAPKLNIVPENPLSIAPDIKSKKEEYLIENNLSDLPQNLKHYPEQFFIRINGYGRDYKWADYAAQSADLAASQISNNESFADVMAEIASNMSDFEMSKREEDEDGPSLKALGMGVSRLDSPNSNVLGTLYTMNGVRYGAYGKRFSSLALKASRKVTVKSYSAKTPEEFKGVCPTQIYFYPWLNEGKMIHKPQGVAAALKYSEEIYDNLLDYKDKKLTKKDIKEVNRQIATMHWLLATSVPYLRGSDSIVNIFIKSLYSALGFEISPPKEGISFDLEAFSSELKDYIKKYPSLYENEPKYVL